MNAIIFPMLNLKLNISQVAFSLFGIQIYWYAVFIVFAMIIAFIIFKIRDGLYNIKYEDVVNLLIFLIPISIVSARLYYVIFAYKDYIDNPLQIFNFRTGGLAIYGGIIGGIITCVIFCKRKNIKILDLLDFLAPGVALRTSNRKMGKFCKYRSVWNTNNITLENGNI